MTTDPLIAWRASLALIAPELHAALGELLLRLHPLVGNLRAAFALRDELPQGVGSVQQRGAYERLLISEWAYADAVPDEFIRRAANNELLFLGPEPEKQQSANLCVALFDCGPAQLGQPRLAHLALLILLARRAQEANAEFKWGSLQNPGELYGFQLEHPHDARANLQQLIAAHSLQAVNQEMLASWQSALAEQGKTLRDCWQIGASYGASLPQASARVKIEHALLAKNGVEYLQVALQQGHSFRDVELALPDEKTAVRLLREPFAPIASHSHTSNSPHLIDLKFAPLWQDSGKLLAIAQPDGKYAIYHIPDNPKNVPGRTRSQLVPEQSADKRVFELVAVSLVGKNVAYLAAEELTQKNDGDAKAQSITQSITQSGSTHGQFKISRFAGLLNAVDVISLPSPEILSARRENSALLPVAAHSTGTHPSSRLLLISPQKQLVCYDIPKFRATRRTDATVSTLASKAFALRQFRSFIFWLCANQNALEVWRWQEKEQQARCIFTLAFTTHAALPQVKHALLSKLENWEHGAGLLALHCGADLWLLGSPRGSDIQLHEIRLASGFKVIGLASSKQFAKFNGLDKIGLLALHPKRQTLFFYCADQRYIVTQSPQPIIQATFECFSNRLAILTDAKRLTVLDTLKNQVLRQVDFAQVNDEEQSKGVISDGKELPRMLNGVNFGGNNASQ